jgi:hypothetical protein
MTDADPALTLLEETKAICAELEVRRERYYRMFLMIAPMSFALICAIAAMNTQQGVFPWVAVWIFTALAVIVEFQLSNHLYRKHTKAALLHKIAEALGLQFSPTGCFPLDSITKHGILPPHDVEHIEDGFHGSVNGIDLGFQEIRLMSRVRDTDDKIRYEQSFWGLVLRLKIAKTLSAHTVVLPRRKMANFFRRQFTPFQPISLVSPQFEKRFEVLSTDQVESRYILDPAFMERMMEAAALIGTKDVEISFLGDEMAFAIEHARPMFEIGWLFKPLKPETLTDTVNELQCVLHIVAALKLNPYTGLGAKLANRDI